jgi:hypothetical protein
MEARRVRNDVNLEYLPEGSEACPLLRLFNFSPAEALQLQQATVGVATQAVNEVVVNDMTGVRGIAGCRLTLKAGKRDIGVRHLGGNSFECVLTPNTWDNVSGLIEPFCEPGQAGYQWLVNVSYSDANLLLSRDGSW